MPEKPWFTDVFSERSILTRRLQKSVLVNSQIFLYRFHLLTDWVSKNLVNKLVWMTKILKLWVELYDLWGDVLSVGAPLVNILNIISGHIKDISAEEISSSIITKLNLRTAPWFYESGTVQHLLLLHEDLGSSKA
jgi:hypothetical protein